MLGVKRSCSSFFRKCNASYLHFGFTAIDDAGVWKPQCVVSGVVLSNDSMKPSNLKRHLHSKHKKSFFKKTKRIKMCAKNIYGLSHINTKVLRASYKVTPRIAKAQKPYSVGETVVKDCFQNVCLEILGKAAATKVAKVPL